MIRNQVAEKTMELSFQTLVNQFICLVVRLRVDILIFRPRLVQMATDQRVCSWFSGYDGTAWLNDLWKYDIESRKWTCIQESSDQASDNAEDAGAGQLAERNRVPSRRFGYVSVVHDGKLLVFGGFDGSRWLADMYVFDFKTKRWSEIEAKGKLPSPRSCPAWAKDDTHVYIQGEYCIEY